MKILYVEDNKINAMVMDKMLSSQFLNVIIAENGTKALDTLKEVKPDLILVDINLGIDQMDGCELLAHLKKLDDINDTPIYAVTSYAMPGDKQRFIKIGFDKYFSKPVDFKKLMTAIELVESKNNKINTSLRIKNKPSGKNKTSV
ncbi:response regulator [Aquimarina sp. ERC-38]|uniref:response regulator n=1 Tax=Aquimarina sp. ERC-38 TaxID=2949996 RepID=UPI002247305D|nr:response regulator [Aquimarina sp. ERC-38]UZO79552.1 response regulator [Aquimarina sp. ERC-38]